MFYFLLYSSLKYSAFAIKVSHKVNIYTLTEERESERRMGIWYTLFINNMGCYVVKITQTIYFSIEIYAPRKYLLILR